MDAIAGLRGGRAPRRLWTGLLAGLALAALMAAAIATTRVPPRPPGRVLLAAPVSAEPLAEPLTEADERAARARIAEALSILRAHAIAWRLAEADAALAAVRAGADPAAVARWEALEARKAGEAAAGAPLPAVEEAPEPLPLPPVALAAIAAPPAAPAPAGPPDPALPAAAEAPPAGASDPPPAAAAQAEVALALVARPAPLPPSQPGDAEAPAPIAPAARVFIHHVARPTEAGRLAGLLPEGVRLAEVRGVRATPAAPDIRYFFADDRAAAERLALALSRAMGSRVAARDFSHFRPLPQPGTLEVWLPQP